MLTRRDLLKLGVHATVVYGLAELGHADEPPRPDTHAQALARMRDTRSWGVGIAIPGDAAGRAGLARALDGLVPQNTTCASGMSDAQRAFYLAVFSCADRSALPIEGAETAVLMDEDGRRMAGAVVDLSSADGFARGIEALLAGDGRLEARARKILGGSRAALVRDVVAAVDTSQPDRWCPRVHELGTRWDDDVDALLLRAWPHPAPCAELAYRAANAKRRGVEAFLAARPAYAAAELADAGPPAADALDRGLARARAIGAWALILAWPSTPPPPRVRHAVARLAEARSSSAAFAARGFLTFRACLSPKDLARLGAPNDAAAEGASGPYPRLFWLVVDPSGQCRAARGFYAHHDDAETELLTLIAGMERPEPAALDATALAEVERGNAPARLADDWPRAGQTVVRRWLALRTTRPEPDTGPIYVDQPVLLTPYERLLDFLVWNFTYRGADRGMEIPYGVRWDHDPPHLSDPSVCGGCGMGSTTAVTRRFLDYYSR